MPQLTAANPKFDETYTAHLTQLYRKGRWEAMEADKKFFSQKYAEYLLGHDVTDWDDKMDELARLCRAGVPKKELQVELIRFNACKPTTDFSAESWREARQANYPYSFHWEGKRMSLYDITHRTDFIWRLSGLLGDKFLVSVIPDHKGPIVWRTSSGLELGEYGYHIVLRFFPDGVPADYKARIDIVAGRPFGLPELD